MNSQDRKQIKNLVKGKKPNTKKGEVKYEASKLTSYKGKGKTKLA